jgi:oligopeptide transport system ATP-binding protein
MIATALAMDPQILIADEPTTALDVTVQRQIMALLADLQRETGMALVLITHDLGVVAEVVEQALVMYAGKIVEEANVNTLFDHPAHPYTRSLIGSMPRIDNKGLRLNAIAGSPPAAGRTPSGCAFHPRCPDRMDKCEIQHPELSRVSKGQAASCHLHAITHDE